MMRTLELENDWPMGNGCLPEALTISSTTHFGDLDSKLELLSQKKKKKSTPAKEHSSVWTASGICNTLEACPRTQLKNYCCVGKEPHGFRGLPTLPLEVFFFLVTCHQPSIFREGDFRSDPASFSLSV